MKPGDEFPVQLSGYHVANGIVEEIDGDEVVIIIPATRVKMGIKTSLTDTTPEIDRDFTALVEGTGDAKSEAAVEVEAPKNTPAPDDVKTEDYVPLSQLKLDEDDD